MENKFKFLTLFLILISLFGCARKPGPPSIDPYEKFNRKVFAFNRGMDRAVLRPIAKAYHTVIPPIAQIGVTNFFDNIQELDTLSNDLLQGKIGFVSLDFWRFVINTTLGVGGLIDVASSLHIPKHYQDFGLTFAYWSRSSNQSPFIMLPFFGPSTGRDFVGLPFDFATAPQMYLCGRAVSFSIYGVQVINLRSQYLAADKLMNDAFDPYIFVRDAYLQTRNRLIENNKIISNNVIKQ